MTKGRPQSEENFWSQVQVLETDQCWPWVGYVTRFGYGSVTWHSKPQMAHRVAFFLTKGAIPDGLLVRHKCDNARCCNPSHLELGTTQDNVADRVARNRSAFGKKNGAHTKPERHPKGERQANAKLKDVDIPVIRDLFASGHTIAAVARLYGMGETPIRNIRNGTAWKHVK